MTSIARRELIGGGVAFVAAPSARAAPASLPTAIERGLEPAVQLSGQTAAPMMLKQRMAFYRTPGVSIAIVDRGQLAWARGYGLTDTARGQAVTADTLFQVASLSKSLTALAALRLVEAGRVSLDRDINETLVQWQVPPGRYSTSENVTLRLLLSHSAGFERSYFPAFDHGRPVPSSAQMLRGEAPATNQPIRLQSPPGRGFSYSNGGYLIIQLMLEEATGMPFPELMREWALNPLGLSSSTFAQTLPASLAASAAFGHTWGAQCLGESWGVHPDMAGGGLWTTAPDIARFIIAMQQVRRGQRPELISAELAKVAFTRQLGDWGVGFGLSPRGESLRFRQSGSNDGFQCAYDALLDGDQGIIVLTNAVGANLLVPEILRGAAIALGWKVGAGEMRERAAFDHRAVGDFAGKYSIGGYEIARIDWIGTTLRLRTPFFGDGSLDLIAIGAVGEDRFLVAQTHAVELRFHRGSSGAIEKLTMHRGVFGVEGAKVDDVRT